RRLPRAREEVDAASASRAGGRPGRRSRHGPDRQPRRADQRQPRRRRLWGLPGAGREVLPRLGAAEEREIPGAAVHPHRRPAPPEPRPRAAARSEPALADANVVHKGMAAIAAKNGWTLDYTEDLAVM